MSAYGPSKLTSFLSPPRRSDERMADIAFFNLPVRLAKTFQLRAGSPRRNEIVAFAERIGGNGRRDSRKSQSLPARVAAPGHHRIEEPLDHHSQSRRAPRAGRIDLVKSIDVRPAA